jgi:hypothetical protein
MVLPFTSSFAGTLLSHGRFRRGDNRQEDRALIERALALFEEMGATAWAEEARAGRAKPDAGMHEG